MYVCTRICTYIRTCVGHEGNSKIITPATSPTLLLLPMPTECFPVPWRKHERGKGKRKKRNKSPPHRPCDRVWVWVSCPCPAWNMQLGGARVAWVRAGTSRQCTFSSPPSTSHTHMRRTPTHARGCEWKVLLCVLDQKKKRAPPSQPRIGRPPLGPGHWLHPRDSRQVLRDKAHTLSDLLSHDVVY
jgi:hypothetical protein